MHAFVPKARRPKFGVSLKLHDLNNVPLVNGSAYVKWHIRDSPLADSRGRTNKAPIKDHRVTWNYSRDTTVKMTIGRDGKLNATYLDFEIVQEYSGRERIILGTLYINLAEYTGRGKETRRYLMQDSKINSTLQVSIQLEQLSGDTNFTAPELKPPQVFSGIAGVVGSETAMIDSSDNIANSAGKPSEIASLSFRSREVGRMHDIYRKTLAASWQMQAGEMNAVDCIEDIFNGGDGWKHDRNEERSMSVDSVAHMGAGPVGGGGHGHGHGNVEDGDMLNVNNYRDQSNHISRPASTRTATERSGRLMQSEEQLRDLPTSRLRSRSHSGRVPTYDHRHNQEPPQLFIPFQQPAESSTGLSTHSASFSNLQQARQQARGPGTGINGSSSSNSTSNLINTSSANGSSPILSYSNRLHGNANIRSSTPHRENLDVDEESVRENLRSWVL